METNTPDNDLPHDWDLDMQYEDRYACLGDAEIRGDEGDEDWMLQENWPETDNDWENTPDYDESW